MASKFVLLECNRLRASLNYKNIDEEEDQFKNEWVNNVNSYGIVVNPGDVITCESSAINTVGASDTTIEFLQKENKNGYLDNQCQIEFGFYVCDAGANLVKLPLINTRSSLGPTPTPTPEYKAVIGGNTSFQYNVRNRMIGENYFEQNYNPFQAFADIIFQNAIIMPQNQLVYNISLSKVAAQIGYGYRVDGIYNVIDPTGTGGTNMRIKVLEIVNEPNKPGIPSQIEIFDAGDDYVSSAVYEIGNASDGGTNPHGSPYQHFQLHSYLNPNFRSKYVFGPSGKRYYFPKTNWTGPYQIPYEGMPSNDGFGDMELNLNPDYEIRSTTVNLEVPVGLNTPDNIGAILTDQLQKGKIAKPSDDLDFINYDKYTVESVDFQDVDVLIKPPIVESPCYKAMPSNGQGLVEKLSVSSNTFSGCRQLYYNKIGYLDPYKLKGLYKFNQWYYGKNNFDPVNQINTGSNQVQNIGDFLDQEIGNLGLFTSLMVNLPTETETIGGHPQDFIKYPKNGIILTNIYFNKENLKAISEGFRICEEYYDDLTQKYQTPLDKTKLAVNMDIGRYVDALSQSYPIKGSPIYPGKQSTGQRARFKTPIERWSNTGQPPAGTDVAFVDEGQTSGTQIAPPTPQVGGCKGNIPLRSRIYDDQKKDNDGQQLSQLIVRSRFDPTLYYDPVADNQPGATPDDNIFQKLYSIVSTQGTVNQNYYQNTDPISDHFINSFNDVSDNNKKLKTDDLIKMAEQYDLAVIPIFPKNDPTDPFNPNQENKPFIGFFSRYELGYGNIDNDTLAGTDQRWAIDSRNCPYGIQLGYDPSPIRNPQAIFYNTNFSAKPIELSSGTDVYNPVAFMGAVNPSINFSPSLSRFQFSGLNTPMTIGNGLPTNNQANLEATGNPEQQCYNVNANGQIADIQNSINFNSANESQPPDEFRQFAIGVPQVSTRFVDSYSGLGILKINLLNELGEVISLDKSGIFGGQYSQATGITDPTKYPGDILDGTLLGKMGFKIEQLLPQFGSVFANFKDPVVFLSNVQNQNFQTYLDKIDQTITPMTSGVVIDSPEYQPTETNSVDMPLYGIGTNMGLQARPAVVQAAITAQELPTKLDYPYLLIYSSIIQGGTDTQYYGGLDGKSKLPCVGYITRNYNNGDFFYSLEQSFNYTANKSFTLTEIKTEIRLPDGSRPRLQPHNSVIYKITKPMVVPEPLMLPQPQDQTKKATKKKKVGDGDMP